MLILRLLAALFGLAAVVANAQFGPPPYPSPPADSASATGLDAQRAARADAILQAARARMDAAREQIGPPNDETTRATLHAALEAIRLDTEQKLAAFLSPDEVARLRAQMPLPRTRLEAMQFRRG